MTSTEVTLGEHVQQQALQISHKRANTNSYLKFRCLLFIMLPSASVTLQLYSPKLERTCAESALLGCALFQHKFAFTSVDSVQRLVVPPWFSLCVNRETLSNDVCG